jgi:hypothetical protein
VQDRALDHTLEAGGRLRIGALVRFERLILLLEILAYHIAQLVEIHTAGGHHLRRVLIVDQRQQQVLERGIFVPPLARIAERCVEGLFEVGCETGH